jgi:hypothetical protein
MFSFPKIILGSTIWFPTKRGKKKKKGSCTTVVQVSRDMEWDLCDGIHHIGSTPYLYKSTQQLHNCCAPIRSPKRGSLDWIKIHDHFSKRKWFGTLIFSIFNFGLKFKCMLTWHVRGCSK